MKTSGGKKCEQKPEVCPECKGTKEKPGYVWSGGSGWKCKNVFHEQNFTEVPQEKPVEAEKGGVIMTELEILKEKYNRLIHAMQTGVAAKMEIDSGETQPKHLRVGVNSALCDNAALTDLLIKKGIITEIEYMQALVDEMEKEVKRYEGSINEYYRAEDRIKLI